MDIRHFSDASSLYAALAGHIHEVLHEVIARRGQAVIALPGGQTPAHYLPEVFARQLPWDRLTVVPTDERWVPVDDAQSNQRLLANLIDPSCRLLGLHTDDATPEAALGRVEQGLAAVLAGNPLDLAVIGMGEDGHVASLFPDTPAQVSPDGMVCAVRPQGLSPRISLSLDMLAQARCICLAASSTSKAALLSRADAKGGKLPVNTLLDHAGRRVKVFMVEVPPKP